MIPPLLLSGGADINSATDNGTTALMMAARENHLDTVALLLENGADLTVENEHGDNALAWAEKQNHQSIVKFLKNYGKSK